MSWLSIPTVRRSKPDRRSERQIDDELDAEFAFHLEQLQRELIAAGMTHDNVRQEALRRFGNLEQFKSQCRHIALKERTMLKRIHVTLTIVLALALAATVLVALQMYRAAAQHREMAIMMRLEAEQVRHRADAEAAKVAATTAFLQEVFAAADPASAKHLNVRELLDRAEARLPELADRPDLQAKVRATIEEAKRRLESAPPSAAQPPQH
jgi:hypothetical protein